MKLIELNVHNIIALCKRLRVKNLYVFGSILTDRFSDESDVDFSFNFNDDVDYNSYAELFFNLHDGLKSLLGRDIDLVDEKSIRNRFFREELDETKQLIYG